MTILLSSRLIFRYGVPSYILYFGESLGDNLLITVIAKELHERGHKNVWIKCNNPELFYNNPYVKLVVPLATIFSVTLLTLLNIKELKLTYTTYDSVMDQDIAPEKHIVLKMADCLGLMGKINIKPVLFFDEAELSNYPLKSNQIVMSTTGTNARVPMQNKEWYGERYQALVNDLSKEYEIIQLGSKNDYPLMNVTDLRGKTSIRQTAAIIKNSRLVVSHVGFLMHLARAVDCPSVIIYGGREAPWQSGYRSFKNIYSDVECSPCWLHNRCNYNRKCMSLISAFQVKDEIINQLNSPTTLQPEILTNAG